MKGILLIPAILIVATTGPAVRAAPVTIKVATVMPRGSPWISAFSRFSATVKKKTRGQVIFKLYTGAVAGDEARAVGRMRSGQIHGVYATFNGVTRIEKSIRVIELPLLYRNTKEFRFVHKSMTPVFKKRFLARGYQCLGLIHVGWVKAYSKYPIRTLSDIRQRKFWNWAYDPMATSLLSTLGARGIKLPVTDVLPSLQAGTIDTAYGMAHTTQALQWHTAVKYVLDLRVTMANAAFLVRKDTFGKLTPAHQKIVIEQSERLTKWMNRSSTTINKKAMRAMIAGGLKRLTPSATFMKKLYGLRRKAWRKLRGTQYLPKDLKKVLTLLTLCRSTSCRI